MMPHFVGVGSLGVVALIVALCARRWPVMGKALWVAFGLRVAVALAYYFVDIPDAESDRYDFDFYAWSWAQQPFSFRFPDNDNYLISAVVSVFYRLFGHSILIAESLSVLMGMGSVVAVWLLARELWDEKSALAAGWAAALFPMMVRYSGLLNREAYVYCFFLFALYFMVMGLSRKSYFFFLFSLGCFIVASMFHGGIGLGAMVFLMLLASWYPMRQYQYYSSIWFRLPVLLVSLSALLPVITYMAGLWALPKVGSIAYVLDYDAVIDRMAVLADIAGSGYPQWVIPSSLPEFVLKGPLLVAYFLFSPFPWDIHIPAHVVGLFDGMLYLGLFVMLWLNRKAIAGNEGAVWITLIALVVILVYSYGVGNSGTALRHRSMVAGPLIVLAAPFLSVLWGRYVIGLVRFLGFGAQRTHERLGC